MYRYPSSANQIAAFVTTMMYKLPTLPPVESLFSRWLGRGADIFEVGEQYLVWMAAVRVSKSLRGIMIFNGPGGYPR